MGIALEVFMEQSLRFDVPCAECGVAGKGTGTAQAPLDQAMWGLCRSFQGF